jgi:lipopolysaccharide/colanic/teichoic acid biosynthesis glycosyltransferase
MDEAKVILPYDPDQEYQVEQLGQLKPKPLYAAVKRIFDILLSGAAMLVLAIPMVIIGIGVKCSSEGEVFYCQERLGKDGKPFIMAKFRSMDANAEESGAQWSQGDDDPRITPFGNFLRKTRLDELPQLWCIFTGKMSLVGPRPEREIFYDAFETYIHGFRERLKVKPGLTGLAQVSGGYDLKPEEKILYDVEYIKSRSLWLDLKIILRTVGVVFSHEGAK